MDAEIINQTPPDPQHLAQTVARLERMVAVGQMLNSTLDLSPLLGAIIYTAAELVGTQAASILLIDERTGELFFAASTGSSREELRQIKVPVVGSIAGTIYTTGEPLIVEDASSDSRHYSGVDQSLSFQTRSLLGVPLRVHTHCIGVLEAVNKLNDDKFNADDIRTLSTLASYSAIAIENARLVASLREANHRLAELDRLKTNFISIASHELRTPLMIVQGFAGFLREQASDKMTDDLDMVLRGASKLQAVIDQMTNLNFLESGCSELKQETFVVQELIEEIKEEWQPLAAAKRQSLCIRIPPTPILIHGDRDKIHLALSNLLNNAVKFTPENGHIELHVILHTGRVEIAVVDDGIGIPQCELTRIFERFYQVEDHLTRHYGGLGLGLCIAKEVIEHHGGRIWAESNAGQGSCFRLVLPMLFENP
ncbi:MAG TPA: ATP-binding protein [Anaerolineae bacterium]|nr:ATP-binding protein [Anaerolineae bacterium]HQH37002.1 ATP-binding protein [Anaerolineae bacterium]